MFEHHASVGRGGMRILQPASVNVRQVRRGPEPPRRLAAIRDRSAVSALISSVIGAISSWSREGRPSDQDAVPAQRDEHATRAMVETSPIVSQTTATPERRGARSMCAS